MNKIVSDRHIVVVLFVLVFITFSMAHEDSKDLEQFYSGFRTLPAAEKTASIKNTGEILLSTGQKEKSSTEETVLR
jgi:hypothetical protein